MLSCKSVCHLISESLDIKLPLHKRFGVRLHLFMCKACQRMARQMKLLREAARYSKQGKSSALHPEQEMLSKEASARILSRLRQAEHHSTDN